MQTRKPGGPREFLVELQGKGCKGRWVGAKDELNFLLSEAQRMAQPQEIILIYQLVGVEVQDGV